MSNAACHITCRTGVTMLQCVCALSGCIARRSLIMACTHTLQHCNIVTPLLQNGLAQQQNNAFDATGSKLVTLRPGGRREEGKRYRN